MQAATQNQYCVFRGEFRKYYLHIYILEDIHLEVRKLMRQHKHCTWYSPENI